MKPLRFAIIVATLLMPSAGYSIFAQNAPKPYGPLPKAGQLKWHQSESDGQAKDEIMKSMKQSQDYWNAGNLEGFMHNYWHSDSLKFIGKNGITYGWEATLKRYQASYPDKAKQGTLKFDFIHLEKISDDAWFQVGKYTQVREKDTLSGHFSLLWRKINGQWRIVADHSS
ncbi:MAG: nuclear transport factor 2 family protein [Bacteroidales bacterium]|jgi:hypothetical protein